MRTPINFFYKHSHDNPGLDSDRLSGGVWSFKVLTEKRKASPHIYPSCLIAVWGVPVPVVEMDLEIAHKIMPASVN
jgi:hypothetical protein